MKTSEVLRTARAHLKAGYSVESCSFGDWPDAVLVFDQANPWWRKRLMLTRKSVIRALDRAIRLEESRHCGSRT